MLFDRVFSTTLCFRNHYVLSIIQNQLLKFAIMYTIEKYNGTPISPLRLLLNKEET